MAALVTAGAAALWATPAMADPPLPDPGWVTPLSSEIQHLHFRYGPLHIPAGQNLILIGPVTIEKPAYDGYMIAFRPNMVDANGVAMPIEHGQLAAGQATS